MMRQGNISQMKEQDKITAKHLNEMKIASTSNKYFKILVTKILTGLEKNVDDLLDIQQRSGKYKKNQS